MKSKNQDLHDLHLETLFLHPGKNSQNRKHSLYTKYIISVDCSGG